MTQNSIRKLLEVMVEGLAENGPEYDVPQEEINEWARAMYYKQEEIGPTGNCWYVVVEEDRSGVGTITVEMSCHASGKDRGLPEYTWFPAD